MQGHIRQRSEGSWEVLYSVKDDTTGRRKQKQFTVKGTRRDAEKELRRILRDMDTGSYVEPSKLLVGSFLEKWLEDYAKSNLTARTFQRYREIVRCHLSPALGSHALEKLQPLHIQAYYTEALESGRRDGSGGLSAKTVLHHHRVLRGALKQAVKWRLLAINPADAVEPPRPTQKEIRVLTDEEVAQVVHGAKGTPLSLPILIALSTGLRRGEVLGLRWEEVDMKRGTLAVRQSLEETREGLRFKTPKTKKSRRVVAMPATLIDLLIRHKGEQAKERLLLGPTYEENGLVIARSDGSPVRPEYVTLMFGRLTHRLNLPDVSFHTLRHTHATQLLREGIHPKVVSERLGHATVGLTLDTYSHVLPDMQEEAAKRIDNALRSALED